MNTTSEEKLFEAAAKLPIQERADFLGRNCGSDPDLLHRLNALLAAHDAPTGFLPDAGTESEIKVEPASVEVVVEGQRIGRYKLLEKIGEGGCGVVYVAEQSEPIRRRVALKVIKLGMDTRQVVARFEAERQALAMMDHPNIAKVLDAGATEQGRPYFVMELVRGIRITDYCDQHHLTMNDRLQLFIKVCQAIQHAHQKGIIHRDIKPSNILVTLHDGVPVPKVIDFGIAKATEGRLTDATIYTQLHQFIGTPAYMSPEQAEMSGLDIDTRADLYSLGVLLYELLTGRTPFDGQKLIASGIDAMRKTIRETEPIRPSTRIARLQVEELTTTAKVRSSDATKLIHLFKGDLDWIVMKCLEKDRSRRYETANGLAMDLKRHLNYEPVTACPPSAGYRLQKAWRRNRLAYTAGFLVAIAFLLGLGFSIWQAVVATEARNRAVREEAAKEEEAKIAREERKKAEAARLTAERYELEARRSLYTAAIYASQRLIDDGNFGTAERLLAAHIPASGQEDVRGWEWRYLSGRLRGDYVRRIGEHEATVTTLAVSPDGLTLLSGDSRGGFNVWNLQATPPVRSYRLITPNELSLARFSASGRIIATLNNNSRLRLWRYTSGEKPSILTEEQAVDFSFFPKSEQIAVLLTNGTVELRDLTATRSRHLKPGLVLSATSSVLSGTHLAISPDESRVAITGNDRAILVLNLAEGSRATFMEADTKQREKGFMGLSFLDGNLALVTYSFAYGPEFWSIEGDRVHNIEKAGGRNLGLAAVAADGDLAVFAGWDHTVRIWSARNRRERARLQGHRSEVRSVALSPDGTIYSGGQDRQILQWDDKEHLASTSVRVDSATPLMTFSMDGQMMGIAQRAGRPLIIHLPTLSERLLETPGHPLSFSSDGQTLHLAEVALTNDEQGLERWMPTGRLISANLREEATAEARGTFVQDVQKVAGANHQFVGFLASNPQRLVVKSVLSGEQIAELPLPTSTLMSVEFSPDRSTVVTSGPDAAWAKTVWDLTRLEQIADLTGHHREVCQTAFSPDSRRLATGSLDGKIRLWRTDQWVLEEAGILTGHTRGVSDVAFSPDGKTLASCCDSGTVNLWNVETKKLLSSFSVGRFPTSVEFSPDGRILAVMTGPFYSEVDEILIFSAPSIEEVGTQPAKNG